MVPIYKVKFWRSLFGHVYVDADSEEAAREKFEYECLGYDDTAEDCGDEVRIESVELQDE
jgi:hypothetical protein